MKTTELTLVLMGISALATAIAAVAAWRAARFTWLSSEGSTYHAFLERYNSEEMASALRMLDHWRKQYGEDKFAEEFIRLIREYEDKTASGEHHDQEEAIAEVNKARRHVKMVFLHLFSSNKIIY